MTRKNRTRLTWSGNIEAQQQSDIAFAKAIKKRKVKIVKRKKKKQKHHDKSHKTPFIDYKKYLKSKWWKTRRLVALDKADNKCSQCNSTIHLSVHHLNYTRLNKEKDEDLVVLCRDCHAGEHNIPTELDMEYTNIINEQ